MNLKNAGIDLQNLDPGRLLGLDDGGDGSGGGAGFGASHSGLGAGGGDAGLEAGFGAGSRNPGLAWDRSRCRRLGRGGGGLIGDLADFDPGLFFGIEEVHG